MRDRTTLRDVARRTPLRNAAVWWRHRGLNGQDLFLASFPRSGNTWLRHLFADLLTGRDVDPADVETMVPEVGRHIGAPFSLGRGRVIKTHEPFRPEYRRAIYIIRDVRDVVLSYERFMTGYGIRFDNRQEFMRAFMLGSLHGFGTWIDHVASWTDQAHKANVIVLRYEDLWMEPLATLRAGVAHAGLEYSDEQLNQALTRNSLAAMRGKEQRHKGYILERSGWQGDDFIGMGAIEGWHDQLSRSELEILAPALRFQQTLRQHRELRAPDL